MTTPPIPSTCLAPARTGTLIIGIILILALNLLLTGCDDDTSGTATAKIGDQWFTLEIASTRETRAQGFMDRTEIPADGGMIFIFNDATERTFWMKNCLIDMDILYLDRAQRIISAHNMKAQPLRRENESETTYNDRMRLTASYPSRGAAQFVIELKAGKIQELHLERGEKVQLDQDNLKLLIRTADDSP